MSISLNGHTVICYIYVIPITSKSLVNLIMSHIFK